MNFIDFARSHGLDLMSVCPSEKIRRCGTLEKPRSTNGAYFWDGERGWVWDWSGEARTHWFHDPNARPWTDEEKRLWASKRAAQASNQSKEYDRVAKKAQSGIDSAKLGPHNYPTFKGFPDERMLVLGEKSDSKAIIPMRNVKTNTLQGYQEIYWDGKERKWNKKMLYGMRAKNAVFWLGQPAQENWLVEGYATGLSVRKALRSVGLDSGVCVCFSAGNMVSVADQIGGRRYVFADNDESGVGAKSAQSTGLPWTMADEVGQDANDLHLKAGLFAAVAKIMEARQKRHHVAFAELP